MALSSILRERASPQVYTLGVPNAVIGVDASGQMWMDQGVDVRASGASATQGIDGWGSMCRGPGNLILASPAILQETFTTIAVYPGWEARLGPEQKLEVARRLREEALTLEGSWLRTREAAERLLGLTHLSLHADDLSATITALEQAGVRILHATRTWNAEHASGAIFGVDPDGTRIEVVQSSGSRPSTG